MSAIVRIGNALDILPKMESGSVNCVVTSPPYWGLRSYLPDGDEMKHAELGCEETPGIYVANMVAVFRRVRRVLGGDGTLWLNLGDSYAGSWGNQGRKPERGTQRPINGEMLSPVLDGRYPAKESNTGVCPPGLKPKDLVGIPWRVALALQADGWYLRSAIIWAKPNGMPGSQEDRCTSSYETVFLLSKSARYWSDFDAIKTPPRESSLVRLAQWIQMQAGSHRANGGAKTNGPMKAVAGKQRGHGRRHDGFNDRWDTMTKAEQQSAPVMMRDVWFVSPEPFREAHFAVMPSEIARRCIVAGCPAGGTVLDPFTGSGTTGAVACRLGRNFIGIELSPEYAEMAERRIAPHRDQMQLAVTP